MSFDQAFLNTLIEPDEKASAEYFNSLPISYEPNIFGNKTLELHKNNIKDFVNERKISSALNKLSYADKSLVDVLNNIFEYSNADLDKIIAQLEALQSRSLRKLIAELKAYQALSITEYNAKFHPNGLYGCLTSVCNLCSLNFTTPPSLALQHALLKGVVMPVFSLFDDLEQNGDLNLDSIPKLKLTKAKMLEALTVFKATQKAASDEELRIFDKNSAQNIESKLSAHKDKLKLLEGDLVKLEDQYRDEIENLTPPAMDQLLNDIGTLTKEISELQSDMEALSQKYEKHFKTKRDELANARLNELRILSTFFNGMNDEISYMMNSVQALEQKREINNRYPLSAKKSELKSRKKEIKKLQDETGLHFLLSDDSTIEAKHFIEGYGGKLILNQSQAKLAAMAHSQGLCGGYSAEFLEVCSSHGWKDLTFQEKLRRFKPILKHKDTIKLSASANLQENALWMTFESGVRWNIQSDVYRNSDVFKIDKDDKSHAIHKKEKDNTRAFYQRYVDGLMKHINKEDSARLMFAIYSEKDGHALALNYDKDGFLFHDSNTGYIRFENKAKFSQFLVEYLSYYYPDLSNHGNIHDFDKVRKNVKAKDKLKLKSEQSRLGLKAKAPETPSRIKKQETLLLQKFDTLKLQIESVSKKLKTVSSRNLVLSNSSSKSKDIRLEKSKSQKTLSFYAPKTISPQERKLRDLNVKNQINNLANQYFIDFDDILNQKPVLKQRVFNELQIELFVKRDQPDLEGLRKLCKQHNLPKCMMMLDEISSLSEKSYKVEARKPKPI